MLLYEPLTWKMALAQGTTNKQIQEIEEKQQQKRQQSMCQHRLRWQ